MTIPLQTNILIEITTMSLFENPLGRMYGPFFLLLYALICLAAILYVRYRLPKRVLRTADEDNPKIPDRPDPYEIAYLWQTENELLSLVIFNLVRRGYLTLIQTRSGTRVKKNAADVTLLSMMETEVYRRLDKEKRLETFAKDVYRDSYFRTHTESLDKSLKEQGLLWSVLEEEKFRNYKWKIIAALAALGLYKIIAAIQHGHSNFLFIILIALVASINLMKVKVIKMPSIKGYTLHEKLKQIFRPTYGKQLLSQAPYTEQLLLGIYGFGLLAGSDYVDFYTCTVSGLVVHPAIEFDSSTSGAGSCSGGSGCGGGGGCGGGCGGCGGCS